MPHSLLIQAVQSLPQFPALLEKLPRAGHTLTLDGLAGSAPAVVVGALHRARPERIWVVVAATPETADYAHSDLETLLGEGEVSLFPQRESLPYELDEPHVEIGGQRVEALEALLSGRAAVLVTTARALQELSPAVEGLDALHLELAVGEEVRPAELAARFEQMGFQRVGTVEEVGQFALRGGIIDIFGFGSPEPARIEFWGDSIESIRHFDVLTQLSVGSADRVRVLPVDVRFSPATTPGGRETGERRSLLDYLPPEAMLVHLDGRSEEEWERSWLEIRRLHQAETLSGHEPEAPERIFLPPGEIREGAGRFPRIMAGGGGVQQERLALRVLAPEPVDRDMPLLGEILRGGARAGQRTLILCDNEGQLERLQELLSELKVSEGVTLAVSSLSGGFILPDAVPPLRVLTDHEIFRRTRRLRRRRQFRGGAAIESFAALKAGDYVVHMDHGIGRFRRMEQLRVGEEVIETLVIEYAGSELLRLPVHRIDLIERWVSDDEDSPPKVHRIGGKEWTRTRKKTQQAIEAMTADLLQLYAAREASVGHSYSSDSRWQREMESSFLFEDTPDQRKASSQQAEDEGSHWTALP